MLSTIKRKTLAAFGLIILISIVITTVLIVNTAKVANNTNQFFEAPYVGKNAVWVLRRDFLDNQRALYKFLSVPESNLEQAGASLEATLESNRQEIFDTLAELRVICEGKGVDALFDNVEDLQSKESALQEKIIQMIYSKNGTEAARLMRTDYQAVFDEISETVLQLFEAADNDAQNFINYAKTGERKAFLLGFILTVLMVAVSGLCATLYLKALMTPLKQFSEVADRMVHGELSLADRITYHSSDELGRLADSMRDLTTGFRNIIFDIAHITSELAVGNFLVTTKDVNYYNGDYQGILAAMRNLRDKMNDTLYQINHVSEQVAAGSEQVSTGAQALSQGATEQASSVEELAATITEISKQVKDTAVHTEKANAQTDTVEEEISICTQQMQSLTDVIHEINETSQKIGNIIKTIEDIAFQTNILALNAAVEAARAGEAGKGFAVVADEVRSLAAKCAEASQSTAGLIEDAIRAVENGLQITDTTAASLTKVVEVVQGTAGIVHEITDAANLQANSIAQVTQGIDQISSVVQTNSATAEESAAASEELSGQAQMLSNLVGQFKLRDVSTAQTEPKNLVEETAD